MAKRENSNLELRVAEEPVTRQLEGADAPHFPEWLLIVAKRKFFILKFVAFSCILSVIVSFLLPKVYTARTRIMPPQQNQSLSLTAMMSQLGPLAALAGQGLGLRTPSDIYVAMLKSDTVADALIDRFSLMKVYDSKFRVDARKRLEGSTTVSSTKEGIISVEVDDREPWRAAGLANGYVDELAKLTHTLAVGEAAQRRVFFERETKATMDDLANAEVALKQTQEKTGLILLDAQSRAIIETLTSLRARVAAKEVEIRAMQSFAAPGNPDLARAEQELAALRAQEEKMEMGGHKQGMANVPIENVPTAGLEYIRRFREVKYREALFELLAKQFEAAKIDEARDTFLVQQIDKASVPEKKSWPLRGLIVIGSTLLFSLLAVLLAFYIERLERAREDPQFSSQLQLFKFYLRRNHKA
jgi:tyrosine-protein kinase Etk/Wzc